MGLAHKIPPSNLFPARVASVEWEVEELSHRERWDKNHPSFELKQGEDQAPGVRVIAGHVDAGMGELYRTVEDAEQAIGAMVHPAPLGTITKIAHGKTKHRVIQYMKRNVEGSAVVP